MKERFDAFSKGLDEFYHAPYRRSLTRAYKDEEDFFMLLIFAESLGLDNPVSFYTLELQPFFWKLSMSGISVWEWKNHRSIILDAVDEAL